MKKTLIILLLSILTTPCRAGIAAWAHDYLKFMDKTLSAPVNPDTLLRLRVTRGEYEPVSFAVCSSEAVSLTVSVVSVEGSFALPLEWLEIHEVRSLEPTTPYNRLYEIEGAADLMANINYYFWITVHPPENAPARTFTAEVVLQTPTETRILPLQCEVLPFTLAVSPITGGVFMAGTDIPASWYRDMNEHGLNAIQFFWSGTGIQVIREGDKLVLDLSGLDHFMANFLAGGMNGPVTISLGNDYNMHYERAIAAAFDIPVIRYPEIGGKAAWGPEISPQLDSLFVEGLRQILDHWNSMNYPELVVLIYDEPTERLIERHKSRFDLLKTVMPDTRVYGVVMNRRSWAEDLSNQCDIIVSDGDYLGCRDVAAAHGLDCWVYSFPLNAVSKSRYRMGLMAWRSDAQATWFWMYNYWKYDPDGCAVYPHTDDPEKLIRTTYWEGIREGIDDIRYMATAQGLIEEAGAEAQWAADTIEAIRKSINPETLITEERIKQIRDELIEIIIALRTEIRKPCDINNDGRADIRDVIALLLLARSSPGDPRLDRDGDSTYSINDVILLLTDIFTGNCRLSVRLQGVVDTPKMDGLIHTE